MLAAALRRRSGGSALFGELFSGFGEWRYADRRRVRPVHAHLDALTATVSSFLFGTFAIGRVFVRALESVARALGYFSERLHASFSVAAVGIRHSKFVSTASAHRADTGG